LSLPNILTISRFGFALILVALLLQDTLNAYIFALGVFVIASITDYYDGYYAKKLGLTSDFGKIMDPIADKFLMLSLFTVLAYIGMVEWWMVFTIAVREVLVTFSRLSAMAHGQVLAAEKAGKIKTVVQMTAVSLILLYLICELSSGSTTWFMRIDSVWRMLIQLLMIVAVILTVLSGISFFRGKAKLGKM
jgi:CDP-diacylglycerol--glycerol-3-phosphate 3-phosphatidyltransferase